MKARQRGINLCCLSEFCIGDAAKYQSILVLNYSNMDESAMQEIITVLGEIFQ